MTCSKCGAALDPDDDFCPKCGASVNDSEASAKAEAVRLAGVSLPATNATTSVDQRAECLAIMQLCQLSGADLNAATAFIEGGASQADVRKELATRRAAASSVNETISLISPAAGTQYKPDMSKPEHNPLLQYADEEREKAAKRTANQRRTN